MINFILSITTILLLKTSFLFIHSKAYSNHKNLNIDSLNCTCDYLADVHNCRTGTCVFEIALLEEEDITYSKKCVLNPSSAGDRTSA